MSEEYYYVVEGKRHGPVAFANLRELATKAELKRIHKVWCRGMKAWQPADSVEKLFDDLPPDLDPELPLMPPLPPESGLPPPLPLEEAFPVAPSSTGASGLASFNAITAALPDSLRNPRTLVLLAILVCVAIGVAWNYIAKEQAHRNWEREAPAREEAARQHDERINGVMSGYGQDAGVKVRQNMRITGLGLGVSSQSELRDLAEEVWKHPTKYDVSRPFNAMFETLDAKESFIQGFIAGYSGR